MQNNQYLKAYISSDSPNPRILMLRKVITMFTTAHHLSYSATYNNPLLFVLISSYDVSLRFQSCLFSSGFPTRTFGGIFLLLHTCHMLCPFHTPWFHHSNNIWRRIQITNRLNMQFFPTSSYFVHFTTKYLPPILETLIMREVKFRRKIFITT